MGRQKALIQNEGSSRLPALSPGIQRRKPRSFPEWKALRRWGKLPPWEIEPAGYRMRLTREVAGLTQSELARRLGCSQQAVAQAERWQANPTVDFLRRWADECGGSLEINFRKKEGAFPG